MAFCSNCGHKLADGAKFCDSCGVQVGEVANSEGRKTFFDGEVHKCPQCGEVLNSFTGNCPSCGYELRGVKAVSSVQKLVDQLAEIEKKRENQDWKNFLQDALKGKKINPVDEEKINLIQNFPIPTAKEDIREFLILAKANMEIIPYGSQKERESQLAVASAWEVKYKQAYQKAEILLKNDDDFKSKEQEKQKIKRRNKILAWVIPIGCVLFIGFWVVFGFWMENLEEKRKYEANPDGIRIGLCDEDFVGKQYEDVVTMLESKGFVNVEVQNLKDLIPGWITKEGTVESVSIDGDTDFENSDRFDYDVKIVIRYHGFK